MLKLRVKDIPPEGLDRLLKLDGAWFVAAMGDAEGAWAEASGEIPVNLSRTGYEVLARGEVRAKVEVPCARCLEPATVEVRSAFAVTFVPTGSEGGEEAGDPDVETYDGDEIDLQPLARENVLLGIPMSALCRPDCKGLCPQCGRDLNQGPCGCTPPAGTLGEALKRARRAR